MSFQHFRLGQLAMSQPLPPHLQQNQHQSYTQNIQSSPINTSPPAPTPTKPSTSRPPYGSGDTDDGYTLVFPNIAAFQEWRAHEEETQMVEFVKGDTHGSKAVPPRFKDHTKLVCARHSRSGRKKYVKKHPERVRKVPSRKVSPFASTHDDVCLTSRSSSSRDRGVKRLSATRPTLTLKKSVSAVRLLSSGRLFRGKPWLVVIQISQSIRIPSDLPIFPLLAEGGARL